MLVGIVAGEASGDLLGANLINALKVHRPQLEFVGIAGPKMQAAGARTLFPMEKLAVRGYVEVLRHFFELVSIRRRLAREFLASRPRLFIGIDAPDFNLGLETRLKAGGITTVQYVGPQIWAWRAERIVAIKRAVSCMLTLFPFETRLYEMAGIPVSFVGHPLADALPMQPDKRAARAALAIDAARTLIALLPGSRVSELNYHASLFVAAANEIARRVPNAAFVVPLANAQTRELFDQALAAQADRRAEFHVLQGRAQTALAAADVALVASGTATLEAALLKCPMVIAYKLSRISYRMMSAKNRLPYVGLPNVLSGELLVPELLQDQATPDRLAEAVIALAQDESRKQQMVRRFMALHASLRQDNACKTAAALLPYLQ